MKQLDVFVHQVTRSWKAGPINKGLEKIPGRCLPLNIGFLHLDFHVISSCEKTATENWKWFLPVQAATTQLPLVHRPSWRTLPGGGPWRINRISSTLGWRKVSSRTADPSGSIRSLARRLADGRWFLAPRCSLFLEPLEKPIGNWHELTYWHISIWDDDDFNHGSPAS